MVFPGRIPFAHLLRLAVLLILLETFLLRAETIYDNSATNLNRVFNEKTEYGDQVDFGGTARRLTQILFEYFGDFAEDGDETLRVRIYSNETPYDQFRKAPTTLLFESAWLPIKSGYDAGAISGLNVQLPPHTATVTFEFAGIATNEVAGMLFYGPPTVGYSFNEIWFRNPLGNWVPVLYSSTDPTRRANVALRLIAEPDVLLDQRQTNSTRNIALLEGTNRIRLAQTFSPAISGRLNHVTLSAQFTNGPIQVRILDTIGQTPGPNVLGEIFLLRGGARQPVYLIDEGIYLKAGTNYAIELSTSAPSSVAPSYLIPVAPDRYGGGHLWSRQDAGGAWVPVTDGNAYSDAVFETHMIPAAPAVELTHPRPKETFDLTEPIELRAVPRPLEIGTISHVRFLDGVREIGRVTNAPYVLVWTNATPGEHTLRAVAEDSFRRPFRSEFISIDVNAPGAPENDHFARRKFLSGTAPHNSKPTTAATLELGEPRAGAAGSGATVWWEWTAHDGSPVTMSARNSSFPNANIAVFLGNALNQLTLVTNGTSFVRFIPSPGVTYSVVVDPKTRGGFATLDIATADVRVQRLSPSVVRANEPLVVSLTASRARVITNVQLRANSQVIFQSNTLPAAITNRLTTNGFFDVRVAATDDRGIETISDPVRLIVRPENDAFEHAKIVPGFGGGLEGSTLAATTQTMDTVIFETNSHSVWFQWKAPASGLGVVQLAGRQPGSFLGVYTRRAGQARLEAVTRQGVVGGSEFSAVAGEDYYLFMAANHPEDLRGRFHLRPGNDSFHERGFIEGDFALETFFPAGGGLETNEPLVPDIGSANRSSVWWSWTAPATADVWLKVRSTTSASAIAVFTGTEIGQLQLLKQNAGAGVLSFRAQKGSVYHIRAVGRSDASEPITLTLSMKGLRVTRPAHQQFFLTGAPIPLESVFIGGQEPGAVEFLANGVLLTNLHPVEQIANWTNAPAGVHEIRARLKGTQITSAPVWIVVQTNFAAKGPALFAGAFSRASYIVDGRGAVSVFGAQSLAAGTTAHADAFHAAEFFSLLPPDGWRAFAGAPLREVALTEGGMLFTNGIAVDFPPAVASWSQVSAASNLFAAISQDGNLYLHGTTLIPRTGRALWRDVKLSANAALLLAQGGEAFVMPHDGTNAVLRVPRPAGVERWTQIDASIRSALLLGSNGELYSLNLELPFSAVNVVPFLRTRPSGVSAWRTFFSGGNHQLFLAESGALFASGRNLEGQLGLGRASASEGLAPVPFPEGVSAWTQIAAGEFHSLALGNDCQLYAWGSNEHGQLGLGRHILFQHRPTPVDEVGNFCPPSVIRIESLNVLVDRRVILRFETTLNRSMRVEYSADLIEWKRAGGPIPGDGQTATWIDGGPPVTERPPAQDRVRFYRIVQD